MFKDIGFSHLLVVDDDDRIRSLLSQFLNENNFIVSTSSNVEEAKQKLDVFRVDLIILDIMMPQIDGLSFLKQLRQYSQTPVLVLTAKWETQDRIDGLELGADDYLCKPFDPKELLLRIQSILKRADSRPNKEVRVQFGPFVFDAHRGILTRYDAKVSLTTAEASLLRILSLRCGQVVSRDEIARLSHQTLHDRNIDVQVARLRKKIEDHPHEHIVTIRNNGYVLWGEDTS